MAWVRPRAGCSCVLCLVCGGPCPWARRGEKERCVSVCVCACVRVPRLLRGFLCVVLCLERLYLDE